jgi:uncharacterized SAM-binding protein YcdF (DUF218 family)
MRAVAEFFAGVIELPLALGACLLIGAAVLRIRYRAAATIAAVAAALVVYTASIPWTGQALLRSLEERYPPLVAAPVADTVVVLGSSYSPQPGVPVAAALDDAGLVRIVSGVDWVKRLGGRLVVSGGAPEGRVPSARGYAALAAELGVSSSSIEILDGPLDTADEALAVAALLNSEPFVLVTSASHMPRAIRLMERAGARPIPAPTDQQVTPNEGMHWSQFVPRAAALQNTEEALHEYLGLAALAFGLH